jgi:hypothetical protein
MIKTQVQLSDHLHYTAKAIAEQREGPLAEVIRRGLEHKHKVHAYPIHSAPREWKLPVLTTDAFVDDFDRLDLKALVTDDELGGLKSC